MTEDELENQRTLERAIRVQHENAEIIVSWVLIGFIAFFAGVYFLWPKAATTTNGAFNAFPFILALYTPFLLLRLFLSYKRKLGRVTLTLSIFTDVFMVAAIIWSSHLQYGEAPPFALKSPTFTAFYMMIALRALAFSVRYLVLTGVSSMLAYALVVAYSFYAAPTLVTLDYPESANGNKLLFGTEVEKLLSLLTVTMILVLAVSRTRKLLLKSISETQANRAMSRFFSPEIAAKIKSSGVGIEPGKGEHRNAAILMMDLRGFTKLSTEMPANAVMKLLADYQSRMVSPIFRNGGTIDKFMGDGIMAHFGAASPSTTYAGDCLRAVLELESACHLWNAERRIANLPELQFGIACAVGDVIFGAVGDKDRLELTTIGEAVNLAAKLEKHTKAAAVMAVTTETMYYRSLDQGFKPAVEFRRIPQSPVAGVPHVLNLVVLAERPAQLEGVKPAA